MEGGRNGERDEWREEGTEREMNGGREEQREGETEEGR